MIFLYQAQIGKVGKAPSLAGKHKNHCYITDCCHRMRKNNSHCRRGCKLLSRLQPCASIKSVLIAQLPCTVCSCAVFKLVQISCTVHALQYVLHCVLASEMLLLVQRTKQHYALAYPFAKQGTYAAMQAI